MCIPTCSKSYIALQFGPNVLHFTTTIHKFVPLTTKIATANSLICFLKVPFSTQKLYVHTVLNHYYHCKSGGVIFFVAYKRILSAQKL